jgi:tetratricopeptide (TPR) repeat protein
VKRATLLFGVPIAILGVAAAAYAFRTPQASTPRRQAQALIETGRLDDAERMARAAGPRLGATLGDVLVLRGRLAAADSAYRATIAANSIERHLAEAGLAELAKRRGDADEAFRRADALATAYERSPTPWASDDHVAAARAYRIIGSQAKWTRAALGALDAAVKADSSNVDAIIRIGDLFLDTYDAPDARDHYNIALRKSPNHPRAVFGLAKVLAFQDSTNARATLTRAVAGNPSLIAGHEFIARSFAETEQYDSARVAARKALAVDSASMTAWSILGAAAWVTGDSGGYRTALAAASRLNPRPAEFYATVAEAAVRNRRYADAVQLATQAVAYDTNSVRALGVLGINKMRTGDMVGGRAALERAFALDPYHLWHKNTLDLLDQIDKARVIDRGRFKFVLPPEEADLLVMYLAPLLEESYDSLAKRYDYRPPTPIRLEIFRRHADFSVRTVGLTGLGALGVSFGTTLAMDAPSARDAGTFNWGSTAWHELAHTFTLGKSAHRVPRWLSEGLSVFEERRARPGWGADVSVEFLASYKGNHIRKASELTLGFVQPRYPEEIQFSYVMASLVCEMIFAERGAEAFRSMLAGYAEGLDTPAIFQRVFGTSMDAFDSRFDAWLKQRYAQPLRFIVDGEGPGMPKGQFVELVKRGTELSEAGNLDSARKIFELAQPMFPEYAGINGPAWHLANIKRKAGDLRGALEQITKITRANEVSWEANRLETEIREAMNDFAGAADAIERQLWVVPYEATLHAHLAELATRAGQHTRAIRERQAVLALNPADRLDARYQLAKTMAAAGDVAGARREILAVLETAPGFEKAQALLLELRGRTPNRPTP